MAEIISEMTRVTYPQIQEALHLTSNQVERNPCLSISLLKEIPKNVLHTEQRNILRRNKEEGK